MQTSGMRACSQIPECSLSYTKIMQGECNGKEGKRSFPALDTAEPKLILCKVTHNPPLMPLQYYGYGLYFVERSEPVFLHLLKLRG